LLISAYFRYLERKHDITVLCLFQSYFNASLELLEDKLIANCKQSFPLPTVNTGPQQLQGSWGVIDDTWTYNKVREVIAVKVLHTSLLNTTVVAFKVLPLRSYALMSARNPPFKTILELVLWNGLQSCHCITPDVGSVIKMPSFQ